MKNLCCSWVGILSPNKICLWRRNLIFPRKISSRNKMTNYLFSKIHILQIHVLQIHVLKIQSSPCFTYQSSPYFTNPRFTNPVQSMFTNPIQSMFCNMPSSFARENAYTAGRVNAISFFVVLCDNFNPFSISRDQGSGTLIACQLFGCFGIHDSSGGRSDCAKANTKDNCTSKTCFTNNL